VLSVHWALTEEMYHRLTFVLGKNPVREGLPM
jgi:hypothetical protein